MEAGFFSLTFILAMAYGQAPVEVRQRLRHVAELIAEENNQ